MSTKHSHTADATQPAYTNTGSADAAIVTTRGPRTRSPPRRVTVSRVQTFSPAMRRITFTGPELAAFAPIYPASYIKLILPESGQIEPTRPTPDSPRAASVRTYSPLATRPDMLEVDVDFVLHGVGPASIWAAQAKPGQVLYLGGTGYPVNKAAVNHLLIANGTRLLHASEGMHKQ